MPSSSGPNERRVIDLTEPAAATPGQGQPRPALLRRVGGAMAESAWVGAHVARYPWGVVRERRREVAERTNLDGLSPLKRGLLINDVVAAGTPIVLLHGIFDNRAVFLRLRRQLHRRGFGRMVTPNYSILSTDIRALARRLGEDVERLCAETGYERVHIVGHSLGGVIARYYVQRLGGDERVHTLVTLGSPHAGTVVARAIPTPLCRQLRPGSELLSELAEPAPGVRTRFVALWSDLDELVLPSANARLDHPDLNVRNVFVPGTGHLTLPNTPRVVREISQALAYLDSDGATVTAGVTTLN